MTIKKKTMMYISTTMEKMTMFLIMTNNLKTEVLWGQAQVRANPPHDMEDNIDGYRKSSNGSSTMMVAMTKILTKSTDHHQYSPTELGWY